MGKYDDIIALPHHESKRHPPMSMQDRAAQFAPFAALTGYGESIQETSRQTERKAELDEEQRNLLDRRLEKLLKTPEQRLRITYFCPDKRKEGGEYRVLEGKLKRVDAVERKIIMEDGTVLSLDAVSDITQSRPQEGIGETSG